ncbi:hypothetical protein [Haloarcula sp. JP-L23]|uniref:hypothetical protein n=1 Tax=Haloarcula sp. JP-L23 TaxID=2716717 RepID=UPI00140F481A|nr:hypothetical protein G9465_24655 [Haloarcula sp. JP-L23]
MVSDDPTSLRQRVKQRADALGVDPDDLLIQSRRRDPMYKGTDADHAKAEWFADLWQQAVAGRDADRIHIRGVHYYIVMSTTEESRLNLDQLPVEFDAGELDRLQGPVEPPTNCSWDVYQNTDQCYDYLESAGTLARILGYIPLGGIYDNKHAQRTITQYGEHRETADVGDVTIPSGVDLPTLPEPGDRGELSFDGPEDVAEYIADDIARSLAEQIEFDTASQQPFHVELWCEKGLPDYIHALCADLSANVIVEGEGDLSLTIAHEFVQRVNDAGKPAIICYLSDFDPKGDNMSSAMAGKVAWLNQRGDLDHRVCIEQVAVTKEQVDQFGLPRKPISESDKTGTGGKAYDTLVDEWEQRKGTGACELNTLEQIPDLYKHIVREAIAPYRADDLHAQNRHALGGWVDEVRETLVESLTDAGVPDDVDTLEDWLAEWNNYLSDLDPVFERLQDMQKRGVYAEWVDQLETTVDDTEWPTVTVPEGEQLFPNDPLYDSDREYAQNVRRVEQHKSG